MYLTEMHEQVRDVARRFADKVIRPAAEALDRDEAFPRRASSSRWRELGLFGISVPEE